MTHLPLEVITAIYRARVRYPFLCREKRRKPLWAGAVRGTKPWWRAVPPVTTTRAAISMYGCACVQTESSTGRNNSRKRYT